MSHADRATYKVQFDNGRTANRQARVGSVPALPPPGPARVPRVARLMALAIRFDGLVRCGQMKDFAQIARLDDTMQPDVDLDAGSLSYTVVHGEVWGQFEATADKLAGEASGKTGAN
jgi:hypothetical protein